jgi:very-short-patch-repair endonuclease
MTKWEIRLWNDLKGRKMFGFKVRRQYGVEDYIVDFYCPKLKLAIEVDGDVHFFKEKLRKDQKKNQRLKEENIKVIRMKTVDFEEDYESMIAHLEDVFRARAQELHIDFEKM